MFHEAILLFLNLKQILIVNYNSKKGTKLIPRVIENDYCFVNYFVNLGNYGILCKLAKGQKKKEKRAISLTSDQATVKNSSHWRNTHLRIIGNFSLQPSPVRKFFQHLKWNNRSWLAGLWNDQEFPQHTIMSSWCQPC